MISPLMILVPNSLKEYKFLKNAQGYKCRESICKERTSLLSGVGTIAL